MYRCPVCEKENTALQCDCGFDGSSDYEAYPTLTTLAAGGPSRSAFGAEMENYLRCRQCGGVHFRVKLQSGTLCCVHCGTEQDQKAGGSAVTPAIALGEYHLVGLTRDGKVLAVGQNQCDQCDVQSWTDVVAISVHSTQTIGLKSDGTILSTGFYAEDVPVWEDIAAVAAGDDHILGLRRDGTVLSAGDNDDGQCDVSHWRDIVAIACGDYHSLGLKKDGTVVATDNGDDLESRSYVSDWTDIIALSANFGMSLGLRKDGTVLTTESVLRKAVSHWRNITAIATTCFDAVGLTKDGTVVTTDQTLSPLVSRWHNVIAIGAGGHHIAALLQDGRVVVAGDSAYNQCDVSNWKLF